jgi:putative flippase GtrA
VQANVSCARSLRELHIPWTIAGLAGIAVSFAWNYAVNQILTWQWRNADQRESSLRREFASFDLSQKNSSEQIETLADTSGEKIVA